MSTPIQLPLRRNQSKIKSWITGTVTAMAVALCVSTTVKAQTIPNGEYEFVSASGSLNIAGKTINVTSVPFLLTPEGNIKIEGNYLYFSSKKASSLIKSALTSLKLLSQISATVAGPNQILMSLKDRSYVGAVTSPIQVNFTGLSGQVQSRGRIKLSPRAKVKAGNLAITVPIGGVFIRGTKTFPVTGTVNVQAKLITPP